MAAGTASSSIAPIRPRARRGHRQRRLGSGAALERMAATAQRHVLHNYSWGRVAKRIAYSS